MPEGTACLPERHLEIVPIGWDSGKLSPIPSVLAPNPSRLRHVIDTATFFLLSATVALALLVAIRFAPAVEQPLVRWLAVGTIVLSVLALLSTIIRTVGLIPAGTIPALVIQVLIYRLWLPIGAALAVMAFWLRFRQGVGGQTAHVDREFLSPRLNWALCVSVALSFAAVEIGKVAHDAEMRQFFESSGLPVFAHYVVMGAELAGAAVLLLLPRWRLAAALGLSVIMLGGILTHANNGDPFTDSLEAVHLFILLVAIAMLSLLRPNVRPG